MTAPLMCSACDRHALECVCGQRVYVIQAGLDFYEATSGTAVRFLATYPIRRPLPRGERYGAERIEEARARSWFEGWAAEQGLVVGFVS